MEELEYPEDFILAEKGEYVLDISYIDPFAKSMIDALDESIIGWYVSLPTHFLDDLQFSFINSLTFDSGFFPLNFESLDAVFKDVLIDVGVSNLEVGAPKNDEDYIVDIDGYDWDESTCDCLWIDF